MNQSKTENHFSIKKALFVSAIVFLSWFFLLLVGTGILMQVSRFERYYSVLNWLITALLAIICSLMCRGTGRLSIAYAAFASGIVSTLSIVIGLVIGSASFAGGEVMIRFLLLVLFSCVLCFAFSGAKKKGRKRENRFRFAK